MKITLLFILITYSFLITAQGVFPFVNNLGQFKSYDNGFVNQVDFLVPTEYKFSEYVIGFLDHKRDLFVYDGKRKSLLTNATTSYDVGLHHVAWTSGPILWTWDTGKRTHLSNFCSNYKVSDSLVVFIDTRDNSLKSYYNDSIYDVYYSVDEINMPNNIGVNSFGFEGNGGLNFIFDRGEIVEVGVANQEIVYAFGNAIGVFNDPINQSFAVYENNELFDLESTQVLDYQMCNNYAVYRDLNENLMCYKDGEVKQIANYSPAWYKVNDNLVLWSESGILFLFDGKQTYQVANYIPEEYQIKNNSVAYRNIMGGVNLFQNGVTHKVTNVYNAPFELNKDVLKCEVANGIFLFWKEGKTQEH